MTSTGIPCPIPRLVCHHRDCQNWWLSASCTAGEVGVPCVMHHIPKPMRHILNLPWLHSRHIPSSLGSPCHHPLSIIRGAVPPLNIIITCPWLLLATSQYHGSLPSLLVAAKLPTYVGLVLSSHAHLSSIILFAQVSDIALISPLDRQCTSSAPTPHHPNDLRHSCNLIINDPPHSIASIAATFKSFLHPPPSATTL